jgi:YD repeat-containing protein
VTGYALPDVTTWVYDDNGNVLSESRVGPSAGGTTTGTVDAQERLLSWGGASYEYGAAGERLRRVEGASEEAYSWDVYGNLLAVSLADGREVTYRDTVSKTVAEGSLIGGSSGLRRARVWLNWGEVALRRRRGRRERWC